MKSKAASTVDPARLLAPALHIALEAGGVLRRHYNAYVRGGDAGVELKEGGSPVTKADKESSELIVSRLSALTPGIAVVSEENDVDPDGALYWAVDPLDGTKGFLQKIPHFFSVKIALIENGDPVLGIIHEPGHDLTYYSCKGAPAFRLYRNSRLPGVIRTCSPPNPWRLRTVFNGLHYSEEAYKAAQERLSARGIKVQPLRAAAGSVGTSFYMAIATGQKDIHMNCTRDPSLQKNGFPWDYAADALILRNAGGAMVDLLTGEEPRFPKPRARTHAMAGFGDRTLAARAFPKLAHGCNLH